MSETLTSDRKAADPSSEGTRGEQAAPVVDAARAAPAGQRKRWLALLAAAVVAGGAAYGAYYYSFGRFHESTDDAYVSGNLVQPVTLTSDVYGSRVKYHGRIEGFSAGTGSAFATLPAQNATGNWIKIVQRLPVRIQLDQRELEAHPLRIGLSMQVDADTHDDSGTQLGAARNTIYRTDVYAQNGAQADAEIAKIIEQNEIASHALEANSAANSAANPAAKRVASRNRTSDAG